MDLIQARLSPVSQGNWERRGRVQVVSCIGKSSCTSHIRRGKDGIWRGHNPDKAAVARLDAAERLEGLANTALDLAQRAVSGAKGNILLLKEKRAEMDPKEYRKTRRQLGQLCKAAAVNLAEVIPAASSATKAANEVRSKVERMPEFVF